MKRELVQAAVSTFCTVPEVYQQIFEKVYEKEGAKFPEELIQVVKERPEKAAEMLQGDKNLLNGIITIYQQYSDLINQKAQEAQKAQEIQNTQQKGVFAKGGKLDYLIKKYQNAAGNLPKKDNTFMREIRDVGDTTDTKIYNYRTDYRKTYPNGSVIMQSATPSDMSTYYDPRRPKPSFWTRLLYLFPTAAPKSVLENWDELERNHKNDIPALDKTRKIRQ